MDKPSVYLLDAYALIFRGYFAFSKNPIINSKGVETSAIIGFMNSFFEILYKNKAAHLAVVFDKDGSKERSELYKDYKANRSETPEAIRLAVPYIKDILRAMNIAVLEISGYEADDLIGTLSKKAESEGFKVYMVTPDKDYAQLVSENIFIYKPARMGNAVEIWNLDKVKQFFEIDSPSQVIDYLAMVGDPVDNIPGLPGIGDKTARKFLKDYGSIENLLKNTDKLSGKQRENVEQNAELGLLSKKLATIILDVPIDFDSAYTLIKTPDFDRVKLLFKELEFKKLLEVFLKTFETFGNDSVSVKLENQSIQGSLFDGSPLPEFYTLQTQNHYYQLVDSPKALTIFLDKLNRQKTISIKVDFIGDNELNSELLGIGFVWENSKGYYVPFYKQLEDNSVFIEFLTLFLSDDSREIVSHNFKQDFKLLHKYLIPIKCNRFDTILAHYLINPESSQKLDKLSEVYLNYKMIDLKQNKSNLQDIDFRKDYILEQVDLSLVLKAVLEQNFESKNINKLFETLEIPLLEVLAEMELEGITVDIDFLKTLSTQFETDLKRLEQDVYLESGIIFNINSPKQLGDILFEKMGIGSGKHKKTKTGQYATSEDVLLNFYEHKIVKDVLDYRQLQKLKSTYIDALPTEINPKTGRVHTTYSQTVAATGRLSSNNPNLQNIPIRSDRGKEIRKAFIPRNKDYVLLSADYSQIELRIIAALSGDDNMVHAFINNQDIHAITASKIFNIHIESVTKTQRSHAKTVNFGIIYGVSAFGLSNQTELSITESKQLIEAYYNTYPKLRDYISNQINYAKENGYVETVMGRRRYLPNINSGNQFVRSADERNAVNAPIQGSAADIIKIAMVNIQTKLKQSQLRSKMILQVHDELVFDVYKPELDQIKPIIKYEMENAYKLPVPLLVDIGVGDNWLSAH